MFSTINFLLYIKPRKPSVRGGNQRFSEIRERFKHDGLMRKFLEFVRIDIGITAKYKCKQTMWEVYRHVVIPLCISDNNDHPGLLQCQSTLVGSKGKIYTWQFFFLPLLDNKNKNLDPLSKALNSHSITEWKSALGVL